MCVDDNAYLRAHGKIAATAVGQSVGHLLRGLGPQQHLAAPSVLVHPVCVGMLSKEMHINERNIKIVWFVNNKVNRARTNTINITTITTIMTKRNNKTDNK